MPKIASAMRSAPSAGWGSRSVFAARTPDPVRVPRRATRLEEKSPEEVTDAEEHEDHDRHHSGDQGHHRKQFRARAAIHAGILAQVSPGQRAAAPRRLAALVPDR